MRTLKQLTVLLPYIYIYILKIMQINALTEIALRIKTVRSLDGSLAYLKEEPTTTWLTQNFKILRAYF